MPHRQLIFTNGECYHIFNKTIDHKTPFLNPNLCSSFLRTAYYYRASDLKLSFSDWKRLAKSRKIVIQRNLANPRNFRIAILAYCLMPNHFHFVIQQNTSTGVQDFISNVSNSFTHTFNKIHSRKGPLFQNRFQAVPITSSEQLLVVSRYVHLNPIASNVVGLLDQLRTYPWSSYKNYVNSSGNSSSLVNTDIILNYFKNDSFHYQKFVENDLDRLQTLSYANKLSELPEFPKIP